MTAPTVLPTVTVYSDGRVEVEHHDGQAGLVRHYDTVAEAVVEYSAIYLSLLDQQMDWIRSQEQQLWEGP